MTDKSIGGSSELKKFRSLITGFPFALDIPVTKILHPALIQWCLTLYSSVDYSGLCLSVIMFDVGGVSTDV